MTKTEFARKFLLNADILGVYSPKENDDEYDAYIKYTIAAFSSKIPASKYVSNLLELIGSDDFRNKRAEVEALFDESRKQFKKNK